MFARARDTPPEISPYDLNAGARSDELLVSRLTSWRAGEKPPTLSCPTALCLKHALPFRRLARQEKRFDQLTRAAYGHSRESLVPWTIRYLWFLVEPARQLLKL